MNFVAQHGVVISGLLMLPVLLMGAAMFQAALKRYEVVVAVMVASAWIHWVFASNEEVISQVDAVEETGFGTYIRMMLVLFAGTVGYIRYLQARSANGEPMPVRLKLLGVFFAGAMFTVSYSIAKGFTFTRAAEAFVFLGFLLGFNEWLKEEGSLDKALKIFAAIIAAGVLVNAASIGLAPGRAWWWEATNRLQGFTKHPNELGAVSMIAYPLLLWSFHRSRGALRYAIVAVFLVAMAIQVLSGSRSAMACSAIGFFLWSLLQRRYAQLVVMAVLFVVAVAVVSVARPPSFERYESQDLSDLTGREQFWSHGMELVKHRPLLGYGYQVSGKVWNDPRFASASLESAWSSARTSLHNGYLDTLIGVGFIGLLAMVFVLLMPLPGALTLPVSDYRALVVAMVVQLLVLNCTETIITSSRSFASVTFWFFWALCGALPSLMRRSSPEPDASYGGPTAGVAA